jgi:hypothetical protein
MNPMSNPMDRSASQKGLIENSTVGNPQTVSQSAIVTERDLAITFAGGGNRAFYELGLMNRWPGELLPRTACLATCSAGACVATIMLSGIYLQYTDARDGPVVDAIGAALRKSGFKVFPKELIVRKTAGDVRYYSESRDIKATADKIRTIVAQVVANRANVKLNMILIYLGKLYPYVPRGNIEVWLPTSVTDSADTATTSSYGKTFAKILATMKLPGIEAVAAKVHDAWVQAKRAQGITTRKSESGEELMVEYDQLSEDAKELDRASVRAVFDAIESLEREKD